MHNTRLHLTIDTLSNLLWDYLPGLATLQTAPLHLYKSQNTLYLCPPAPLHALCPTVHMGFITQEPMTHSNYSFSPLHVESLCYTISLGWHQSVISLAKPGCHHRLAVFSWVLQGPSLCDALQLCTVVRTSVPVPS